MISRAPCTSHAAWTHDRELCATRRQTARKALQIRSRLPAARPWWGIHAQSLAIPHQRNTRPAGPCVPTPSTKWDKQRSLSGGRVATFEATRTSNCHASSSVCRLYFTAGPLVSTPLTNGENQGSLSDGRVATVNATPTSIRRVCSQCARCPILRPSPESTRGAREPVNQTKRSKAQDALVARHAPSLAQRARQARVVGGSSASEPCYAGMAFGGAPFHS